VNFDQYAADVAEVMDAWLNSMGRVNKSREAELKEAAGDLITGWKESFPKRRAEIDRLVSAHLASHFDKTGR
jgi:hypothetical protein